MLTFLRNQLAALHEARAAAETAMSTAIAPAETEKRNLTTEETASFDEARAAVLKVDEDIAAMEQRIAAAEAVEARRAAAAADQGQAGGEHRSPAVVTSEPRTYERWSRSSYFLDLIRAQMGRGDGDGGVDAARQRLARHAKEWEVEMPKREAAREKASREALLGVEGVRAQHRESAFEKRVNPNRTDGQGGYFVPPAWLIDQYIDLPRFGRTTANLVRNLPLPSGTDSINLPKVATGTAVGVQTADAAPVVSQDLTDTFVNAPVRTLDGQQDIAIQLLDQSPIAFDAVIFEDLHADYNSKLDGQVISGTGANGQVTGILSTAGINAVTYTDASPTLPELWVPLLQSASRIATGRKLPATGVVMTPALWYWMLAQLDTSNRPFLVPSSAAVNPLGAGGPLEAEGPLGTLTYGLSAFGDGNVPSNLGAGTNETRVITARWSDLLLWEGQMRTRVLSEVLSNTLQVRLQIYNYAAFMANRRPEAISVISGTGLVAPTGF